MLLQVFQSAHLFFLARHLAMAERCARRWTSQRPLRGPKGGQTSLAETTILTGWGAFEWVPFGPVQRLLVWVGRKTSPVQGCNMVQL